MTRAAHERFWPRGLPRTLHFPRTGLWYKLEVAATRYPDKPAIVFYDTVIRYAQLRERVDRLAAFLQPHARAALTAEAIEAWCRARMSAYKVPRIVEFIDALPKSATGKVNWRELQEREAAGNGS